MEKSRPHILDVEWTNEEIAGATYAHNLRHAESIVLTTKSVWGFRLLLKHPRLYGLLKLMPNIKWEKTMFNDHIALVIEKNRFIKAQNFEPAGKYRGLEKESANAIVANNQLKSFNIEAFELKNGTVRLFVVLLKC